MLDVCVTDWVYVFPGCPVNRHSSVEENVKLCSHGTAPSVHIDPISLQ